MEIVVNVATWAKPIIGTKETQPNWALELVSRPSAPKLMSWMWGIWAQDLMRT